MFLDDLLLKLVRRVWRGLWHAVDVKRSAPEQNHTATEYVDAFLFADEDEDSDPQDSPAPPSILGKRRH